MEETQKAPSNFEEQTQKAPSDPVRETQMMPSDLEERTQETPLDPEEETQEAPSDPVEETQEDPSYPEEKTQKVPWDAEVETQDEAGPAAGSTDLGGSVVPKLRKLTMSGNILPNNVIAYVDLMGARKCGRSSATKFSAEDQERRPGR